MSSLCQKGTPYNCCCQCVSHIPDFYHPLTTDGQRKMSEQRGWVCLAPDFPREVYSGWKKHEYGCEMWKDKDT